MEALREEHFGQTELELKIAFIHFGNQPTFPDITAH
jgi:hypothetical protein